MYIAFLKKDVPFPFHLDLHLHLGFGALRNRLLYLLPERNHPGKVVFVETCNGGERTVSFLRFCSLTLSTIPWTGGRMRKQSSATTEANLAVHQSWHHNRHNNTM